jgi:hypothetical protein
MAFEKGNKHGTGRPKGSLNKTTAQIKDFLMSVSDALEVDLFEDLQVLQPLDRVKLWLSLQEYLLPKLSRQQIENSDNDISITIRQPTPDYSKLNVDELKVLERLLAKIES